MPTVLRKCKVLYWKLSGDGRFWFKPYILSRDGVDAFDS